MIIIKKIIAKLTGRKILWVNLEGETKVHLVIARRTPFGYTANLPFPYNDECLLYPGGTGLSRSMVSVVATPLRWSEYGFI